MSKYFNELVRYKSGKKTNDNKTEAQVLMIN